MDASLFSMRKFSHKSFQSNNADRMTQTKREFFFFDLKTGQYD